MSFLPNVKLPCDVYHVADYPTQDIAGQTRQVLAAIDKLLAEVGSDKSRIVMAQIFIADLADFAGKRRLGRLGRAGQAPSRATVEATLARPEWRVEIVITAAV